MKTVVGIDLGTQSLKAVFYDYSARSIVASESAALGLCQNDDGAAEQQAQWWLNALHEVMARVDPDIRASAVAVGVSGQQHGFVPLSRSGEVLAPVKLWCDTSTAVECEEITAAFGGMQQCIQVVGNPILPGYTASKIRWLRKERPDRYEQLECVLLPHDFLNYYLTGELCMEAGDASGTGFFDVRERRWSPGMLSAIDPDRDLLDCLPEVRTEAAVIGHVTDAAARDCGLPAGIPVSTGGGDNMMAAIGTGNTAVGVVTASLGTELAKRGLRVVLVDCDLGGANLHTFLGLEYPNASLSDFVLRRVDDLQVARLGLASANRVELRLQVPPAGTEQDPLARAMLLAEALVRRALAAWRLAARWTRWRSLAAAASAFDRGSLVVTFGGGATSDLGGLAASLYMRGIAVVHCPTTLLAQVDAAVLEEAGVLGGQNRLPDMLGQLLEIDGDAQRPVRIEGLGQQFRLDPDVLVMERRLLIIHRSEDAPVGRP